MAEKIIKTTFLLRRGTAAQWAEHNPILRAGEPGFELDTKKLKIGNGEDAFNDLPYIGVDEINFEIPGLDEAEIGQIAVKGENGLEWKDEVIPMTRAEIEALIREGIVAANKGIEDKEEFKAAFAQTGMVKLGADMNMGAETLIVSEGKDIILDLGDKTISGTNDGLLTVDGEGAVLTIRGEEGSIISAKRTVMVRNGGKVVFESGKIQSTGLNGIGVSGDGSEAIVNGGEVEAQEYGLLAQDGGKIEINGGIIEALDNCAVGGNGSLYVDANGNLTTKQADAVREQYPIEIVMNGGKLISKIQSNGWIANGVYMPGSCNFTMNGGEIVAEGGAGVVIRAGKAELNGGKITTSISAANPSGKGKTGDSKIANVPCAPVVWDKSANYPKASTMELVIGENMVFEKPEVFGKLELLPADADQTAITLPANWDNEAQALAGE